MSKSREKDAERQEAIRQLRKLLRPGDTVYTVLRHVSSSGMSRRIDLYAIRKNQPVFLTGYAARVLGLRRDPKHDGLSISGCGMDMGFAAVYELSRILFPKGFKAGGKCRCRNGMPAGQIDPDGGYALNHRWL